MSKKIEKRESSEASKKGIVRRDAYVYGTLRKKAPVVEAKKKPVARKKTK